MTDKENETGFITLYSSGLFSKWGFRDGSIITNWLSEYYYYKTGRLGGDDDVTIISKELFEYIYKYDHELLAFLVEKYLLPEIRENHDVEIEILITSHNPIQALKIDGIIVDRYDIHEYDVVPKEVIIENEVVMRFFVEKMKDGAIVNSK